MRGRAGRLVRKAPVLLSSTSRDLSGKRRCEAGASLPTVLIRPCISLDAAQGGSGPLFLSLIRKSRADLGLRRSTRKARLRRGATSIVAGGGFACPLGLPRKRGVKPRKLKASGFRSSGKYYTATGSKVATVPAV